MRLLATLLGIRDELARIRGVVRDFHEFEEKQRGQQRMIEDLADAFRRRIDRDTNGAYADVLRSVLAKIDTEQLTADVTERVKEILEKSVQKALSDIVKDTDLADRVWEAIDEDALTESVVEALTARNRFETWLKESTEAIAQAIAEDIRDDIDWDTLSPEIGEAIARRLDWTQEKK